MIKNFLFQLVTLKLPNALQYVTKKWESWFVRYSFCWMAMGY